MTAPATMEHAAAMTLQTAFDELYRPLRLRGRSPRTAALYGFTFKAFGRWLEREPLVDDLDDLLVSRYLEHRATVVSPYTAERERVALCALSRLLAERRVLPVPLAVPAGRVPDRVPVAWSLEHMGRLLAAATACTDVVDGVAMNVFWPALIGVLWETGERVGAVMEARVADYTRPHMLVLAEARKGSKRDKLYQLTPATCDRLDGLVAGRDGLVFPWPKSRGLLWHWFRKLLRAAGLAGMKPRQGFHEIRRSAATHFAAAGGDAQRMLDHEHGRTTRRWYVDPRIAGGGVAPCDVLPAIVPVVVGTATEVLP
jgi:integrase